MFKIDMILTKNKSILISLYMKLMPDARIVQKYKSYIYRMCDTPDTIFQIEKMIYFLL